MLIHSNIHEYYNRNVWMSLRLGERRAEMISKRKMGFQRVTGSKCLEVYRLSG